MDAADVTSAVSLRRPRGPAAVITRGRLEAMLDAVPDGGVALLVAPAGAGKSVLIDQWTASLGGTAVARVALTAACQDAVVFGTALVEALAVASSTFDRSVADQLVAGGNRLGEVFVARLVVALEQLHEDLVLVIDDAHTIDRVALAADLVHLLEHLPDNIRVVVASRRDPPVHVHTLRLDGRLVEVRDTDLAFDRNEGRALLEAVSRRDISADHATTLVERTEGWAAGLQLAAVHLQRAPDPDEFVHTFGGTNRLVADYLSDEVLQHLEPSIRSFLLETSFLDWLSPEACGAVTDALPAGEALDVLIDRSLFIVPLDPRGERYRYHHLFADLLLYRLRAERPGTEPRLRRVAAEWLLEHHHTAEAIEQHIRAGDAGRAFAIIDEHGHVFYEQDQAITLVRWLTAIEALDPAPSVAHGTSLLAAQVAAHQTVPAAETYRRLSDQDMSDGARAAVEALYAVIGLNDLPTDEVERASAAALELVARVVPSDVGDFLGIGGRDTVECLAQIMAAVARFHRGDLISALASAEGALQLRAMTYPTWRANALGLTALIRAFLGDSRTASSTAVDAIAVAERGGVEHHVGLGFAHLALGQVAIDRCDTDAARVHLYDADVRARRSGRLALQALHRLVELRRIEAGAGPARALTALRDRPPSDADPPLVRAECRRLEARLLVEAGRARQARVLLAAPEETFAGCVARVGVELDSGDIDAARDALAECSSHPADRRSIIERELWRVAVLDASGDRDGAEAALDDALALAESETMRRPFLEVPAVMDLLEPRTHRSSGGFARSIVDSSRRARGVDSAQRRLIDPLTEREREVLEFLPSRLSNSEVAAALFVSVNTLKTHLRHIYWKLDVTDRDAAVARALDLGLI